MSAKVPLRPPDGRIRDLVSIIRAVRAEVAEGALIERRFPGTEVTADAEMVLVE